MKPSLSTAQIVILILSFVWGVYWVAHWRTQSFGMTWGNLVADAWLVLLFVLPLAVLGVLGLPWRKASVVLLASCIGMIVLAESYACAQEWWVVHHYGDNPGQEMYVNRWPPYSHHYMGYSPGYGWVGGD